MSKHKKCLWCKEEAIQGRSLCEKHDQQNNSAEKKAYCKKWNEDRQKAGLCDRCDNPAAPGRTQCREHLDQAASKAREKRAKRLAAGACMICGCNRPAGKGKKHCQEHCDRS